MYSVTGKNRVNATGEELFGMLYFAEIAEFANELHSEMETVLLLDTLPEERQGTVLCPYPFYQQDREPSPVLLRDRKMDTTQNCDINLNLILNYFAKQNA